MKTMEMNAELFHQLGYIADDETYMQKVITFVKDLVKQKTQQEKDNTCMAKEEFFAMIDSVVEDVDNGHYTLVSNEEELNTFIKSL